ncbi:MAG TPA: hypothetical protein VNW92_07045 [Polyangiaceae bacterium]|nr:hypothetical protein [Polyangiaceae bacterium]
MSSMIDMIQAHLRTLLSDIGQGGVLSPSVYDTAQALRHLPPPSADAALAWLALQQTADGAFAAATTSPLARHVPTLSAVLALHDAGVQKSAVNAGIDFLRRHAADWEGPLPDDIPVAAELILPKLLADASARGLELPVGSYAELVRLGERRRAMIAKVQPKAGTAPVHAWEAWGADPTHAVVDGSGGVGNSPAATAQWLNRSLPSAPGVQSARAFLTNAERATRLGIPGVLPTVWPIDCFEQVWVLYALFAVDLLEHPSMQDRVLPELTALRRRVGPLGLGMSEHFVADGDMTSTALAVLSAGGQAIDIDLLDRYRRGDHFITYQHEMQPSVTTNAHAVLALALAGRDATKPAQLLIAAQSSDGRWLQDKWHSSWLYPTSQAVTAAAHAGIAEPVLRALDAVLKHQRVDGGWGSAGQSTAVETAYAVQIIHAARRLGVARPTTESALAPALHWLLGSGAASATPQSLLWIGKEQYCPYRVDQAFVLAALLRLCLDEAQATRQRS